MKAFFALALACALVPLSLEARAADLAVGSAAPPLTIAEWLKGSPVDPAKGQPDEVYVIEFWATWCGPCLRGIPHLSEMQERFKMRKVSFVGVSDEEAPVVKRFLESGWDAKMRYTVAIDKDGETNRAWMQAAGQKGIPAAFVVKGGKIEWIGHPMDGLDLKVAELCGDEAYAKETKEFRTLEKTMATAFQAEKWKDGLASLEKMIALRPEEVRFRFMKYYLLAAKVKDKEAASKWGREILAKLSDAEALNQIAWVTLTEEEFAETRDLELAMLAARKAVEISKEKDASILDTYARAFADSGDLTSAVTWQKKAVAASGDADLRAQLEETLKEYEERAKKAAEEKDEK